MTTSIDWAASAQPFMQYDGTNSADLCDFFDANLAGPSSVVSEDSGTVTIYVEESAMTFVMNEGDRAQLNGNVIPPADWASKFIPVE